MEGRRSSGAQTVVAARSAKTGQLVLSTARSRNVGKSIVGEMADACSAATKAAGRSIDAAVGGPRTELTEVRRSVGGYGDSTRIETPGVHASNRERSGEEEHASEAGPVRRWTELQLR